MVSTQDVPTRSHRIAKGRRRAAPDMRDEERLLSQSFPEYQGYMAQTARLVPGVYYPSIKKSRFEAEAVA